MCRHSCLDAVKRKRKANNMPSQREEREGRGERKREMSEKKRENEKEGERGDSMREERR